MKKITSLFFGLMICLQAFSQQDLGNVKIDDIISVDTIQNNISVTPPSHSEGLMYWDSTNKTLAILNEESDVVLQSGQEIWVRVYNSSGATINNGDVVYLSGVHTDDFPLVSLAKADAAATCLATIGIATHDIENTSHGYITRIGTVRGLDTSGCSSGDILYLSATTAGELTNVQPESPNYSVRVGNCGKVDAATGTVEVDISVSGNTRDVLKIFNGAILEDHTLEVTSNGTIITATLEKTGGGDLSLFFDGEFSVFDSTPAASVTLTAGSDTAPTLNYVFIPEGTKLLTANTTGFPTAEQFVPVATVVAQSASDAQTNGLYKVHAWTDHLSDSVGQGHLSHVNEWIRSQNATWISGVSTTLTPTIGGGVALTVDVATAAGVILQLHQHTFPALDTSTGEDIHIINEPTTPYLKMQGLVRATLTQDSTGGTLAGTRYNVVLWGVVSEADADCHLFLNLPSGSYGNDTDALGDISKYSDFSIPAAYRGTGFLISNITLRDRTTGGGTLEVIGITDLRGSSPYNAGGGAGGNITEFSDNDFSVYSVLDDTAKIQFDCSNISTLTTRSIIWPDADKAFYKDNQTTSSPSVTDDNTQGYAVGSTWDNTATGQAFRCLDASTGAANWIDITAGATAGEANTASNVGTAGVGVYKQKAGVNLEFKTINAGSSKVTITDDAGDSEIDVDVDGGIILDGEIATDGFLVRTAAETYTSRTLTGTASEITITNGSGGAGNPILGISDNAVLPGTGSVQVPGGTTLQQPGTPVEGMLRKNITENIIEYYNGSSWLDLTGDVVGPGSSVAGNIPTFADATGNLIQGSLMNHGATGTFILTGNPAALITASSASNYGGLNLQGTIGYIFFKDESAVEQARIGSANDVMSFYTGSSATRQASISSSGLILKDGSQYVNEIETTLTDDDTHIPTSGAVFDAIASVGISDTSWNGSNWTSTTGGQSSRTLEEALEEVAIRYTDKASTLVPNDHDKIIKAKVASGSFTVDFGDTLANNVPQSNQTIRVKIPASQFSESGDYLKITFQAGSSGTLFIDKAFVGHQATSGNAWDFDGSQVQVTFNGNANTLITTGTTGTTDEIAYSSFDNSKDLIVSMYYSSSTNYSYNNSSVTTTYFGSGDTAADSAPAGYSTTASLNYSIDVITVAPTVADFRVSNEKVNSPWFEIDSSKYTATPASTSTITFSDTSDITAGMGIKYTDLRGTFHAYISAVTSSLLTIKGAEFNVANDILKIEICDSSRVLRIPYFVPGKFAAAAEDDCLRDISNSPEQHLGANMYFCFFRISQSSVDATSQASINLQIDGSDVLNSDKALVGSNSWEESGTVNTSNYLCDDLSEIEITTTAAGDGAATASENLTVNSIWILE
jgi:hypothetical protein